MYFFGTPIKTETISEKYNFKSLLPARPVHEYWKLVLLAIDYKLVFNLLEITAVTVISRMVLRCLDSDMFNFSNFMYE